MLLEPAIAPWLTSTKITANNRKGTILAIKHLFADLIGTTLNYFRVGKTGPRLKDNSGALDVRNSGDSAFVDVTADQFNAASDVGLVINSDAAGTGADWKFTLQRASTGMTADVVVTLPVDDGTAGQVLSTDGTGVTSWVSAASTAASLTLNSTTVAFGDSSRGVVVDGAAALCGVSGICV